jgi:hypothetical protein
MILMPEASNTEKHETKTLKLNSYRANAHLGWRNLLSVDETIFMVDFFYLNYYKTNVQEIINEQIRYYSKLIEFQNVK